MVDDVVMLTLVAVPFDTGVVGTVVKGVPLNVTSPLDAVSGKLVEFVYVY